MLGQCPICLGHVRAFWSSCNGTMNGSGWTEAGEARRMSQAYLPVQCHEAKVSAGTSHLEIVLLQANCCSSYNTVQYTLRYVLAINKGSRVPREEAPLAASRLDRSGRVTQSQYSLYCTVAYHANLADSGAQGSGVLTARSPMVGVPARQPLTDRLRPTSELSTTDTHRQYSTVHTVQYAVEHTCVLQTRRDVTQGGRI